MAQLHVTTNALPLGQALNSFLPREFRVSTAVTTRHDTHSHLKRVPELQTSTSPPPHLP